MGDPSDRVRDLAIEKLEAAEHPINPLLVESLAVHGRRVRDGVFLLAEAIDIKDVEIFRFCRSQIAKGYEHLAEAEALRRLPESDERDLLIDHLDQEKQLRVEDVLRGLAARDPSGQMKTIWRGIGSADARRQANSVEALDTLLDRSLSTIMMPLLEKTPPAQSLAVGKHAFQLPEFDSNPTVLCTHLLAEQDWVTVLLTLRLVAGKGACSIAAEIIQGLALAEDARIRQMARWVINRQRLPSDERELPLEPELSVPDKILHLREIQIFEGLSVGDLAVVASVAEEVSYPPGEIVLKEGELADKLYLVVSGEVTVVKGGDNDGGHPVELGRFGAGQSIGELALLDEAPQPVTVCTTDESRLLVIQKGEFEEILNEYSKIALHVCKELSARCRILLEKVEHYEELLNDHRS
jgi:hypothetical protein